MNRTSFLAVAIATGLFAGATFSANAADLGGDCCADLEERIAELEVTTVRKGNRKVSVQLYGYVSRALMIWDSEDNGAGHSDQYVVGTTTSGISRWGLKGSAKIGRGWSAGYKLEWGTGDTLSNQVSEANDDGNDNEGLNLRQEYVYLKNDRLGSVAIGHMSTATDGIPEIDLSGTKYFARSNVEGWNAAFAVNGTTWGRYVDNLDGERGDVIRYDSPKLRGFIASFSWGEDDYWDVALRYAGEFGGVIKVAAGIGYQYDADDNITNFGTMMAPNNQESVDETISGSVSGLHIPTGLFLTFAAGERQRDFVNAGFADFDSSYWWIKSGLKRKFIHLGATTLYGEYGQYDNFNADNVEAEMWGLGVAQNIDAAAMQLFGAYRHYELDTAASNEFDAFLLGATIKF